MSKKRIKLVIALMSIALIGLIVLQLYWVDNAMNLQELQFNRNVNEAMNEVVGKLEKQQTVSVITNRIRQLTPQANIVFSGPNNYGVNIYSKGMHVEGRMEINNDTIDQKGRHRKSFKRLIIKNKPGSTFTTTTSEGGLIINGREVRDTVTNNFSDQKMLISFFDSINHMSQGNQVLTGIMRDLSMSIDTRATLDPHIIDSLIKVSLKNHGADADFRWGLYKADINDFLLPSKNVDVNKLAESPYKMHLYSGSIFPKPEYLMLYFPDKSNFLFKQMGFVLSSSALLIFLIIFCFAYTILTLIRQKKLSEMKTDFINNMTHEFKTPVSTILLASDALTEPDIANDRDRFKRLVNVIHEENNRIGSHVERVLQLAAMEKGNLKLKPVETDINELIKQVVESMSIQVEHKNGKITTNLNATDSKFNVDPLHFSNVIRNLLDNAIKYCVRNPEVIVSTSGVNGGILISVEDNGIGLTREQQSRVFEQFYRVPTGNLHDVKGFGLGLHYVRTIVEMHGGVIRVKSEKAKGSTFEIILKK